MYEKETEELLSQLKEDKDISRFLAENEKEMVRPLHEYLTTLLAEKQLNKSEVVRASLRTEPTPTTSSLAARRIPPAQNCWRWHWPWA